MATFNVDGKSITNLTNGAPVVWSTNCGTLFLNAGATTPYVGTSVTSVFLLAQNKTSTGTANAGATVHTIVITGVLPLSPNWGFDIESDKLGVVTNIKRDGSVNGRVLGTGLGVRNYRLGFQNRLRSQFEEYRAFVEFHYPHLTWKYNDLWLEISGIFRFADKYKATVNSLNNVNIEQSIAQVS